MIRRNDEGPRGQRTTVDMADELDERFRRALDSILDLVVVERAIRDASGTIVDFEIVWMNTTQLHRMRHKSNGQHIKLLTEEQRACYYVSSSAHVVQRNA